ncbi:MAG: hypothetical protein ACOVN5_10315 [Aquidulcibacter sp.]|jgi:ABC-2 type transport system permease protein
MRFINPTLIGLEFRRISRTPSMLVPALGLPCLLLLIAAGGQASGVLDKQGVTVALSKFVTFSVQAAAIHAMATSIAWDRESRYLMILRGMPMPFSGYVTAKLVTAFSLCAASMLAIFVTLRLAFDFSLPLTMAATLIGVQLIAAVPTMVAGSIVGVTAPPAAAAGMASLLLFPLGYVSSLLDWKPIKWPGLADSLVMPPPYHAAHATNEILSAQLGLPAGPVASWREVALGMGAVSFIWVLALSAVLWIILRRRA